MNHCWAAIMQMMQHTFSLYKICCTSAMCKICTTTDPHLVLAVVEGDPTSEMKIREIFGSQGHFYYFSLKNQGQRGGFLEFSQGQTPNNGDCPQKNGVVWSPYCRKVQNSIGQ